MWLAKWARGRGVLRWWARRRLLLAGDRERQWAIEQVWALWLEAPDGRLWQALHRWHLPSTGYGPRHLQRGLSLVALGNPAEPEYVVEAARRVGHPIAATARARILAGDQDLVDAVCTASVSTADTGLAEFCVAHQLAPAQPREAALFFLLTGQEERYRLVDPDHSQLALAYRGADEDERARIRAGVAGAPDLVRVLAETVRRGGLARLTGDEAAYLIDAHAERQDWAQLWELAQNLPVLDAAAAVRRFDGRHPGGADAPLFDALAAADPAALAESRRAVARPVIVTLPVTGTNGGSFTPDSRAVVVWGTGHADVFALPQGKPPVHRQHQTTTNRSVALALADDVVVTSKWGPQQPPATEGIWPFPHAVAFGRTTDGFAALALGDESERRLHLLSGKGTDFESYQRRVLDVPDEFGPRRPPRTMAIEASSGLVAFAGDRLCLARITENGLLPVADAPFDAGLNPTIAFAGAGRLISFGDGRLLQVWRTDGDELAVVAQRQIAGANPVDLPAAGVIAMQDMSSPRAGMRQVRFVDRETLADAPARFTKAQDTYGLFAAPDGNWLGVCYWEGVDLVEVGIAELAHRPLGATTPADLATVRARLAQDRLDPATRPYLELLHICLQHRFGAEVALGTHTSAFAPDDIALGGDHR